MKFAKLFEYPDGQVCFINLPAQCTVTVSVSEFISVAVLPPHPDLDLITQDLADQVRQDMIEAMAYTPPIKTNLH